MRNRLERGRSHTGHGGETRRRALGVALVALVALAGMVSGCGVVSGDDPHAGMASLTTPGGSWRLWYLAPPWEVVEATEGHAVLRVPNSAREVVAGGTAGGIVGLVVDEVPGADALAYVRERAEEARAVGATVSVAPRTLVCDGARTQVADATFVRADGVQRLGALSLGQNRLLTLVFTSSLSLGEDGDVTRMLSLVEPSAGVRP